MNGDDPRFNARRRGVPPPQGPHRAPPGQGGPPPHGDPRHHNDPRHGVPHRHGEPAPRPDPRRVPPPPPQRGRGGRPHEAPPQRPAQSPRPRVEPTKVLRHDDPAAQPLAWSRAAEPAAHAAPRTHAPTQRPEPFDDPQRRGPRRGGAVPPGRGGAVPPGPPRRDHGSAPAPRRRRRRRPFRWFLVFLLVVVAALIGGVFHLDGKLTRIDALAGYSDRVGDTPGTNWLLVGSDGRGGLSAEQEAELATGGEVGPERTDTIMLVHIPESGAATLVSLPRDSYVSIPGNGRDKLNASFALGGPQLLVQTVEIATGVHIDHYAQIGFAGFADIVDALGGIDVCVPQAIEDPLAGLSIEAGCQEMDGPTALGFVRTRATALADIDRMNNQRLFLAALLEKATGAGTLANPFRLWPLATDIAGSMKVDTDDHLWDLGRLGWAMRGQTVATTVPIGGFEDTASGNVVLWDKSRASRFFEALASDRPIPEDLLTS